MKNVTKFKTIGRRAALLTLAGLFAAPSLSAAQTNSTDEQYLFTANDDDDPPCGQAVVALEIDTTTGDVYIVDGATGGLTLTDNDITVSFGTMTSVTLDIEYTSGDWEVDITPSGGTTQTYFTRGGSLRYKLTTIPGSYTIESNPLDPQATPVVPIVIQPQPECPPET